MIEVLKADIQKFAADPELLGKEIAEHEAEISTWTGDIKAASKFRETERADYETTLQDYSESIDALGRAIAVLKKQNYDRPQASLTQVSELKTLSLIPEDAKKAIDAFISQGEEDELAVSAPEANAYEFQ